MIIAVVSTDGGVGRTAGKHSLHGSTRNSIPLRVLELFAGWIQIGVDNLEEFYTSDDAD